MPLVSRLIVPAAATLPAAFAAMPATVIDTAVEPAERGVAAPADRSFAILASTYVALNALDIYTTTRALNTQRGSEGNPLLAPVASTPVALTAVKIAMTATTLVIAKRLWKEHALPASCRWWPRTSAPVSS